MLHAGGTEGGGEVAIGSLHQFTTEGTAMLAEVLLDDVSERSAGIRDKHRHSIMSSNPIVHAFKPIIHIQPILPTHTTQGLRILPIPYPFSSPKRATLTPAGCLGLPAQTFSLRPLTCPPPPAPPGRSGGSRCSDGSVEPWRALCRFLAMKSMQ